MPVIRRAIFALLLALLLRPAHAGLLILSDGSTLRGLVTLTANPDAPISFQAAGQPQKTFRFTDVKTAIFDSLADGAAPDPDAEQDYIPWSRAEVSETRRARTALIKGSAITISNGDDPRAPSITGEDRCFVFQKLEWDGEIVAQLPPSKNATPISLGLMISEGLEPGAPFVALTRSSENTPFSFLTVRSAQGEAESSLPHTGAAPASWLKLRRTWDTFRAYESADGVTWSPVGECRAELNDKKGVYIGVTASSSTAAVLAQFDHVALAGRRSATIDPAAADPRLPDVLVRLRSGSILAGTLQSTSAAKAEATLKKPAGNLLTIPRAALASAQFAPTTRDDLDKLAAASPGALLRDGDFLEGEIKDLTPAAATVSSVNFGLTTLERRRITTLLFDASPAATTAAAAPTPRPGHLIEVRLQDGSLLLAKSLTLSQNHLQLEEPTLGPIEFPLPEILSLHEQP